MFKGVGTALLTPFDNNLDVDFTSLKKITKHQIDGNVDAIIILGTTGESPVINVEERKRIISTVMESAGNNTEIIVGTGTNDPKKVVELNKIAEEFKADALLIVNPYYNKGTQESLIDYYKYITERTSLPVILYNVPSRTGMNMLPETIVKIHDACKNVTAVKEASGNISQIAHLMSIKPDSLSVYSGNDDQTLPIMALGGVGIISVFANVFPKELKYITDAIMKNDLALAQNLNNRYLSMMNALFIETSPAPLKYIASKLGLCQNILRLPMAAVSKKTEAYLDNEIKKISKAG